MQRVVVMQRAIIDASITPALRKPIGTKVYELTQKRPPQARNRPRRRLSKKRGKLLYDHFGIMNIEKTDK